MRAQKAHPFPSRRRGMALIVAISVLAILTLIVMALTATQKTERHLASNHQTKQNARELISLGLGSALAEMKKNGPALAEKDYSTDEGKFSISAEPLSSEKGTTDKIYDGKILKHRPGDTLLTIAATVPARTPKLTIEHEYLINITVGQERKIRISETFPEPEDEMK